MGCDESCDRVPALVQTSGPRRSNRWLACSLVGGWDKYRVLFVVKVERPRLARTMIHTTDSEALTLRLI